MNKRQKHSKTFHIAFRDVDLQGNLRLSALVDFMQEISGEHARLLGFDYSGDDASNQDKIFWIVSRAKMHMEVYPKWLDTIRIETYPDGADKLFAIRRFDIFNTDDALIVYIVGYYIFLYFETHRPVRIHSVTGPLKDVAWPFEGQVIVQLL